MGPEGGRRRFDYVHKWAAERGGKPGANAALRPGRAVNGRCRAPGKFYRADGPLGLPLSAAEETARAQKQRCRQTARATASPRQIAPELRSAWEGGGESAEEEARGVY